jgi:hypothetical protein
MLADCPHTIVRPGPWGEYCTHCGLVLTPAPDPPPPPPPLLPPVQTAEDLRAWLDQAIRYADPRTWPKGWGPPALDDPGLARQFGEGYAAVPGGHWLICDTHQHLARLGLDLDTRPPTGPCTPAGCLNHLRDLRSALDRVQSDGGQADKREVTSMADASFALIRIYTDGIADDRIQTATQVLADDKLTAHEKLTEIDALMPLPATASAEQLGKMLGVTKQAVLKTQWWEEHRKDEKQKVIAQRRELHRQRAEQLEARRKAEREKY